MASKRKASKAGLASRDAGTKKQSSAPQNQSPEFISQYFTSLIALLWSTFSQAELTPFESLPSETAYPDYYKAIASPISISEIKNKQLNNAYSSTAQIIEDFELLCRNAQSYNTRGAIIFTNSVKLYSTVHKYDLLRKIPTEYKQFAANVLDMEARILNEVEYYKPRVKNSRFMCDPFIETPSRKDYPDYFSLIKSPSSINHVRSMLWHGQLLDHNKFRSAMMLVFDNAQLYNDPTSIIYQDSVALQKTFVSRLEKGVKALEDVSPPSDAFLAWTAKFDYAHAGDFAPPKDEVVNVPEKGRRLANGNSELSRNNPEAKDEKPTEGTNGSAKSRGRNLRESKTNAAAAAPATTTSLETRSSRHKTATPANGTSTGLKIKLKAGSSPATQSLSLPKRIKLKTSEQQEPTEPEQASTNSHRIKINLRTSTSKSKEDTAKPQPDSSAKAPTKHLPTVTISTTAAANNKHASAPTVAPALATNNKAESHSKPKSSKSKSKSSSVVVAAPPVASPEKPQLRSRPSHPTLNNTHTPTPQPEAATQAPNVTLIDSKVYPAPINGPKRRGRPRTVNILSEVPVGDSNRHGESFVTPNATLEVTPSLGVLPTTPNVQSNGIEISAEPAPILLLSNGLDKPASKPQEEPLGPSVYYPHPSRREKSDSLADALIRYISFSSVVPSVSKYQQAKNPIPPMQQLSMFQIHFPVSENFKSRTYAFWVPYFHHTFSFTTLLHESLNHRQHLVALCHNHTQIQAYQSSDTSPWADPHAPITTHFEVRLATGLNLLEFAVSASPDTNKHGKRTAAAAAAAAGAAGGSGGAAGALTSAATSSAASVHGDRSGTGTPRGSGAAPGAQSPFRNTSISTRNQSGDSHEDTMTERLSLWVTMGPSP